MPASSNDSSARIQAASVIANESVCLEHYRLTFVVASPFDATPGQFVHLSPGELCSSDNRTVDWDDRASVNQWQGACETPMLRRAFSIAGARTTTDGVHLDVIYRVVGKATGWMASLSDGDKLSVLGPLGNSFPVSKTKRHAWMVAGGVGLPPMLWLAEALRRANRTGVVLFGAQSRDLIPFKLSSDPDASAHQATLCAPDFSEWGVGTVVSTDDGSVGLRGHVGKAMDQFAGANRVEANDLVVYTCGPEIMMRYVASFCEARGVECHVCLEQAMACGTGTCQSCVVPIRSEPSDDGWLYQLCCTQGPVFEASDVAWSTMSH